MNELVKLSSGSKSIKWIREILMLHAVTCNAHGFRILRLVINPRCVETWINEVTLQDLDYFFAAIRCWCDLNIVVRLLGFVCCCCCVNGIRVYGELLDSATSLDYHHLYPSDFVHFLVDKCENSNGDISTLLLGLLCQ
jgi:hypothetical protein